MTVEEQLEFTNGMLGHVYQKFAMSEARTKELESEVLRLRSTLSLIGDICRSYEPLAAVISIRVVAEAALTEKKDPLP